MDDDDVATLLLAIAAAAVLGLALLTLLRAGTPTGPPGRTLADGPAPATVAVALPSTPG